MNKDMMNTTLMKVQEETTEERTEETMVQEEPDPMAIETHEVSAKRFHAWGNL